MSKQITHVPIGEIWALLYEAELSNEFCQSKIEQAKREDNKDHQKIWKGALSVSQHFENKFKEILERDGGIAARLKVIDRSNQKSDTRRPPCIRPNRP
jgi:hypothetical protein